MGDPLSATASIIAVVQLTGSIVKYIREIKSPSKECRKLLLEITSTRGILDCLKETINELKDAGSWGSTLRALQRPDGPIEMLNQIIKPLVDKLQKAEKGRGLKILGKALIWPLTNHTTQEIAASVERQKSLLVVALGNDHILLSSEISKQISSVKDEIEKLNDHLQGTSEGLDALKIHVQDETTTKALSWLTNLQLNANQKEIFGNRHGNTGAWFLQSSEFQSWIQHKNQILLCSGIPGSGKTVLASMIVQYLLDQCKSHENSVAVTWGFCNFKSRDLQTSANLIASIVRQLAVQRMDCAEEVVSLYTGNHNNHRDRAAYAECLNLLSSCALKFDRMFLVVDALDECSDENIDWEGFVNEVQRQAPNINILMTTRPIASIEDAFPGAVRMNIRAQVEDLKDYIQFGLGNRDIHEHLQNDVELREKIASTLIAKSQGMFLLTKLQMDTLQRSAKRSKKSLRDAVDQLPEKINTIYEDALQRINSQDAEDALLAKQVLAWVLYSRTAMSPRVLQQAIACQRQEDSLDEEALISSAFLMSICAGLVEIYSDSQLVRLVHYTTEEFLQQHLEGFYPGAAIRIHYICLHHCLSSSLLFWPGNSPKRYSMKMFTDELQEEEDEEKGEGGEREPARSKVEHMAIAEKDLFFTHALDHIDHVKRLAIEEPRYPFERDRMELLFQDYHILFGSNPIHDYLNDVRFAVFFALKEEVRRILESPECPPAGASISSSLCYACSMGYEDIAKMLLDAGANTTDLYSQDSPSPDEVKMNCLGFAIWGFGLNTIQLLLTRDPDLTLERLGISDGKSVTMGGLSNFRCSLRPGEYLFRQVTEIYQKVREVQHAR